MNLSFTPVHSLIGWTSWLRSFFDPAAMLLAFSLQALQTSDTSFSAEVQDFIFSSITALILVLFISGNSFKR